LASSRSRAVEIANEITKDLRESEEELRRSAEQLQAMSRRLVDVQESERRQFSRELHDRVGQNLTALSISVDILKTQLPGNGNEAFRSRLDDAAALLESTAGSIENVMSELRPPMLDDYGLLPALQWYANEFSGRTGIEVMVDGDERIERLPQASEIALFRIMQEALNNIAKHAHARRVHIVLEHTASEFIMSVSDDGVGFDAAPVSVSSRRPGLGMVTMRERTQAVGGQFEIGAASGRGTRVVVRIPC
jgi:signal transduction histidine kinase